ncbi:MAG: hypothetical protein M3R16_05985, partial [Pseudomonadota bacterium]|nr:hypothetical protein [Pseudomonadota bacterium]
MCLRLALPAMLASVSMPLFAQTAAHVDFFTSNDADDTSVTKVGLTFDYRFEDIEHYSGIKLEQVSIRPLGQSTWQDQRMYYRFADRTDQWIWNGQIGTDGDTLLGSASLVRDVARRQEYFVERDILETPRGVEGLYYTFVGAAYDLPLDDEGRQQLTALVGVQEFTGNNVRTHLRGRYIATLVPDWGLSAQLRVRGFHNSDPFEFDYYSPRWFGEVLPVIQLRRFRSRWMYSAALGWGWQRD